MENSNSREYLYNLIASIVQTEVRNSGLLNGNWHLGKVESVINSKRLNILVDGSSIPQPIPCNPDVTFSPQDEVIVIFLNGNSKNKFVICRRAI